MVGPRSLSGGDAWIDFQLREAPGIQSPRANFEDCKIPSSAPRVSHLAGQFSPQMHNVIFNLALLLEGGNAHYRPLRALFIDCLIQWLMHRLDSSSTRHRKQRSYRVATCSRPQALYFHSTFVHSDPFDTSTSHVSRLAFSRHTVFARIAHRA